MGTTYVTRLVLGFLIVILFILAITLAQGIGESFGHGISEMLVP
jgi:hypothetical protein